MASLDFDSPRPYKPNFTMPRGVPEFPNQPRIGANPAGTGLAVNTRPNFTMPGGSLPDEVIGQGPAPKGVNTAGSVDAAVKRESANLQRTIKSGSEAFDAVKAAPKPTFGAGLAGETGIVNKALYAGGRVASTGLRLAAKAGPAAAGADVISHFNDYKINDPSVDSSIIGTWRATGQDKDDFRAGKDGFFPSFPNTRASLGKGLIETGMDVGSFAANTLDYVVPGKAPVSTAYDKILRNQLGGMLAPHASVTSQVNAANAPTAGGLPVQSTASQPGQNDQMRSRSAVYPGQSIAEQTAANPAQPDADTQPTATTSANTLRGQPGTDMGGGIRKFVQGGRSLFSNVQGGDNDNLMNRGLTSAQNQRAMDGIQLRQDQGDAAYAAKRQYDAEVADAQALRKGPTYINSAKIQTERRGQDILARGQDIQARGQDMTYDAAMAGNDATRSGNRAKLEYEMRKDKLAFDTGRTDAANVRGDKTFEQRQASDKSLNDKVLQLHTSNGPKGPIADQNGANATLAGVNTMIARQVADLKKSGTPADLARAKNLTDNGPHALAPDILEKAIRSVKLMNKVNSSSSNYNPLKPDPMVSSDPRDYFDMTKHTSGDYLTKGGQRIPSRFLDKQDNDFWGGAPTNEFDLLKGTR